VVVVEGRGLGVGWEEAGASEWEQRVHGPGAELQMQAVRLQMQAVTPWCGCGQRRSCLHRSEGRAGAQQARQREGNIDPGCPPHTRSLLPARNLYGGVATRVVVWLGDVVRNLRGTKGGGGGG
jgi:hypothetical protein